ncbi:hypothetical protein JS520_00610 [Candidatus Vidania fulgoroideae]|nr:hypothetical protein JS520_00610 [Candidatus Vidania fulgoroideae]
MVVILYSGGLDSTFVIFLLKKLGVRFYCVYIKVCLFTIDSWFREYMVCKALTTLLNCVLLFVDLSSYYYAYVFNRFRYCYSEGLTPNPDIYCNAKLKFNCFIKYYLQLLGVPLYCFAGHYVRKYGNSIALASDLVKDQTYFLCTVFCFCNLFFLLGWFYKYEVRFFMQFLCLAIFVNATSRGICFLAISKFANFISLYCTRRLIIYDAYYHFLGYTYASYLTVGQRFSSFKLGNQYVFRKQPYAIFITYRNSIRLLTKHILVTLRALLKPIVFPKVYYCKVNSCSQFFKCFVFCMSFPYFVRFIWPVRVLAKGQFLVVYDAGVLVASLEII